MIRLTLGAAAAWLLAATGALAAPPPLSAYGALPAIEQVTLSPDGKRLAYVTVTGESRVLAIREVADLSAKPKALRIGDAKVRDISFADADRLLITTSATGRAKAHRWQFGRGEWFQFHVFNVTTLKSVTLLDNTPDVLDASVGEATVVRNARGVAVMAPGLTLRPRGKIDLYRINLDNGHGAVVAEGTSERSVNWLVAPDGALVARTRWDSDSGKWALDARNGDSWRKLDATQSQLDAPSLIGLGRTDGTILVARDVDERSTLFEVSLVDGKAIELQHGADIDNLLFHPRTGRLAATVQDGDEGDRFEIYDPEWKAAWSKVERAFKGRRVWPVSFADDLSRMMVRTEAADDPGSYYLVDLKTLRAEFIADAYPAVPSERIAEVRPVAYKAADGLEIRGYLTLPVGREAKNLPLIVLPHGGPQSHDARGFDWWAQAVASRGYAVLQPNFRGSSGRGKAFVEAGYGQWGRKMQTDVSDGVRHLAAQGVVDPKRVCIMGASYGGYAALAGAAIDTGVYRCAVSVAGVADLRAMLQWEGNELSPSVRYWNRFMGVKNGDVSPLDEVSPARQAAKVTIPVLLIHGRDDTVVPYRQSLLMEAALKREGKPVELVSLAGEDHWLSRGDTRQQMLNAAIAFVEKHNPPG